MKKSFVLSFETIAILLLVIPSFAQQRPNIVWLVSEDNSKHFLRLYEEGGAAMPHIEALAKNGVVFNHAFSQAPVCSVARSTLISGCYAPRIGAQYHRRSALVPMPEDLRMFPSYLRDVGYYCTNNSKEDYNIEKADDIWNESSNQASYRNRRLGQPFFHVQNFHATHEGQLHFEESAQSTEPTQTDPKTTKPFAYHPDTPMFRYTYARYHDDHTRIDSMIGAFIAQLEDDGIRENTIIFYYGDHGGVLPGSKGYLYERGVHVPLVISVPEKWKDLSPYKAGATADGFVRFIDFGPTVLQLAGAEVPSEMDGEPFLGAGLGKAEVESRNQVFCYADRFDEKYDLVRSIRRGDYKYIRNYQPFTIDGLQNNYRYRMAAYREWRELFKSNSLTGEQAQFFLPRAAEAIYNVTQDPHELDNLADQPEQALRLAELRKSLQDQVKLMPDLSFIPEPIFISEGITDPVQYGQRNKQAIGKLVDIADLSLRPFGEVRKQLKKTLKAKDPLMRYWAIIVCSSFGKTAKPFRKGIAKTALRDEDLLVRLRAAEYLGLYASLPPDLFTEILQKASTEVEAGLILNSMALLHDVRGTTFDFSDIDLNPEWLANKRSNVSRRVAYLTNKL